MNPTLKKTLFWIAKLAFTAAIVAYILRTAPVHEIWEALQGARFFYMLPAIGALLVSRVLMGCRMKRVTDHQGMTLTIPQLVGISLTSTFYGTFLPGSLGGGLVRWYRLSAKDQKRSAALAAIAFDRLADTTATIALGLVCWLASAQARQRPVIGVIFAAGLAACSVLYLAAFHAKGSSLARRVIGKLPNGFIRTKALNLLGAAGSYHELGLKGLLVVFGISIAIQLTGSLSFALGAQTLAIRLPFMDFAWMRSFSVLIGMIPITVAGLGVREGVFITLMVPYGIDAAQVVALAVVRMAISLIIASLGGLLELKETFFPTRAASSRSCASV